MPRITTVDLAEARSRLRHRTTGYDARAPYREAIANLSHDRMLEVEPDEGETTRKLKLAIAQASKEVNRLVGYGVSAEGTLLVWLQDKPRKTRAYRRRTPVEA